MRYILIIIFSCFCSLSYGQKISGKLIDRETLEPILFATIIFYDKQDSLLAGSITDSNGAFSTDAISSDVGKIVFQYVGYNTLEMVITPDDKNKLDNLIIYLDRDYTVVGCPIILEYAYHYFSTSQPGEISIKGSHPGLAATFDDPSRSMMRYNSTSTANDQANSIVYRGMPPGFVKWALDGAEIVNPNHLSNAGTFSDRSSASAGGVLSFPFETLENYFFYPNPYQNINGDAIAGISNLEGIQNIEQRNSFIKLGFLGLEAAIYEQISTKEGLGIKAIAAHYRYSFVGLLNSLGVSFDNEEIAFQDLFLRVQLLEEENKKLFVSYSRASSNNRRIKLDEPERMFIQDFSDIDFDSDRYTLGLTFVNHKEDSNYKSASYFSSKRDERNEFSVFTFQSGSSGSSWNVTDYWNFSNHTEYSFLFFDKLRNTSSLDFSVSGRSTPNTYLGFSENIEYKQDGWTVMPQLRFIFTEIRNQAYLEGGVFLRKEIENQALEFSFAQHSQRPHPTLLLRTENNTGKLNIRNTRSNNASLGYKINNVGSRNRIKLQARLFYHHIYNIPVTLEGYSIYDGLDLIPERTSYTNSGRARSYGLEFNYDQELGRLSFLSGNISFFDSQIINAKDEKIDARYNFGYTSNLMITKRFVGKNKSLYLSLAAHSRGGAFDPVIDLEESRDQEKTVYSTERERLGNYFRIDLRANYTFRKKNSIILDIQNISNRMNDSYYRYDPVADDVLLEKQLGMIPVLSYKRIF